MHITRLKLTDYRGFHELDLPLDRHLTVLVGRNGSGKSSVLDAIRLASSEITLRSLGDLHPSTSDIHRGKDAAVIEGEFSHLGVIRPFHAKLQRDDLWQGLSPQAGTGWSPDIGLEKAPIIFLGVDRALIGQPLSLNRLTTYWGNNGDQRFEREGFTPLEHLLAWFREREDVENQERVRKRDLDYVDPALEAARRSIVSFLGEGYSHPRIDRTPHETRLLIDKSGEPLSAARLSDGERSMIVMAANLVRRIAVLDPEGATFEQNEAVVLVDELELHLHPSWQQRIIPAMLKTFPQVQFIVSTHSPQVLSEVPAESLRILENFQLYRPGQPVLGRDANAILREVMQTSERPRFVEDLIDEIAKLLDDEKIDEGRSKLDSLRGLLGPTDSEVLRLEVMLAFLERPVVDGEEPKGA
jgi:predicted ATP-binding protein involved in virulence